MDKVAAHYTVTEAPDQTSVVSDIGYEVNRLTSIITRAEERLDKVLEPAYDDTNPGSEPAPVRSVIRQTHFDLMIQINRLNALLDRVEV